MLSITSVMVLPAYLASTAYLWKMTEDGEFAQISKTGRAAALFTSTLGTFYGLWPGRMGIHPACLALKQVRLLNAYQPARKDIYRRQRKNH